MVNKIVLAKNIEKKTLAYLSLLKRSGIRVDKVIVFGSWAKGKPNRWSDIDLCVVTKQFRNNDFDGQIKLAEIAYKIDWRFEPHLYHPVDLKERYDPLAAEIRKYGIEVKV